MNKQSFAYKQDSIGVGIICLLSFDEYRIIKDYNNYLVSLETQGYLTIQLITTSRLTQKGKVLKDHILKQLELVGEPSSTFTPNTLTEDNQDGE